MPSPPKTTSLSIIDMLDTCTDTVEIAPGKEFIIRPLSLDEMVTLLHENRPAFMFIYSTVDRMLKDSTATNLDFGPVLTSFPAMIAHIIALATDEPDVQAAAKAIQKRMPITVQLIALEKIWKLSVPEPKKLLDLLSGVMGPLQRAMDGARRQNAATIPSEPSPTILPPASNSSSPTDTPLEISSDTP